MGMALVDMWQAALHGIREKSLHQILAFAGEGKLTDGSTCSREFRELLGVLTLDQLRQWIPEALSTNAASPGFALQDLVNELGVRLGYRVEPGYYQGRTNEPGHDGLWIDPESGHALVVEVKSSARFSIRLENLARFREELGQRTKLTRERSSVLIAIGQGTEDTTDLEAQVRGSRWAWDFRMVSLDAMVKMVALKVDADRATSAAILRGVLVPREYTKVDALLDIVQSVARDLVADEVDDPEEAEGPNSGVPQSAGSTATRAYVSSLDRDTLRIAVREVLTKKVGHPLRDVRVQIRS